ncbi:2,3-bisphosphoglycerate-independent phosphoglycerate mutase [Erysipelotrichaceae bacterium OttesenSCG-928-M19]|nr:2,3-bisphosphoglycerate-independent phosphoglycerate mutase [Erysipelotrichaceae bacterium OttesenSCG-928-M19]
MKKPMVLCILDGIGIGLRNNRNACFLAHTPTLDYLLTSYPHSKLQCSGLAVGLPKGQMGNSEVGHLNIGAGRVVYQSLSLINNEIETGSFYENEAFNLALDNALEKDSSLHLMGLLSDGGVHSHIDHFKALILMAKNKGLKKLYLHLFFDGRDTAPDSGLSYLEDILTFIKKEEIGDIASISGRYYAMDRDNRFERNELAYNVMVNHQGASFSNPIAYLKQSYQDEVYDEFIIPAYNEKVKGQIKDDDSVIFVNFRPDRAIQIASLLTNPNYKKVFNKQPHNLTFVSMMKYSDSVIGEIAFEHPKLENVFGVYLESKNLKQLRIAETEKYAHVTFFFDGQVNYDGINAPELRNSKRILIDSPKVATYDLKPEMSAFQVKDALLEELDKEYLDVVILNFANGDMVGHTGKIKAAIKAVETVDKCLKEIYQKVVDLGGTMFITADHGNCEEMLDNEHNIVTAHTTNDVHFIVTDTKVKLKDGKLSDIVPTMIDYMNLEKPKEMSGNSLLLKED